MSTQARVRPATPDDVPGIAAVLAANGEHLEQPGVPGYPYLDFLLGRGRVMVAELEGRVLGFGSAIPVGTAAVVSDLFVDPASHGQGIGSELLGAALGDDEPRMTFSSADPRALPVYVRAGMRPWWPNLYIRTDPGAAARLPTVASMTVEPATVEQTSEAAAALAAIDRRQDFAFYAAQPDAAGFIVRDAGTVAAVGWVHHDTEGYGRELAHASIAPDADAVAAVAALYRAAGASSPAWACVPGPHPAVRMLLEAGARIIDRDTYCTSDPGWLDPERILPNPSLL